ncbi:MAG: hypothetical protein HQK87_00575 [Nitrospinae bacterium]|nr:hypothetical protein [Nitrospinota bacterium]
MRLSPVVVALILSLSSSAFANGVESPKKEGMKEKTSERSAPDKGSPMPSSIRALKDRIIEIQNRSPLMIVDFTLCRSVEGYGSFVPFPGNVVTNAREIQFYYEPTNLFTSVTPEGYAVSFSQDMLLLSAAGEILYRESKARSFTHKGNKPALDIYGFNKIDITGLAPGEYVYKIVVNDELSDAVAEASLPFVIR